MPISVAPASRAVFEKLLEHRRRPIDYFRRRIWLMSVSGSGRMGGHVCDSSKGRFKRRCAPVSKRRADPNYM